MLEINNIRVSNCRALRQSWFHNSHLTNQLMDHLTRSDLKSIAEVEKILKTMTKSFESNHLTP